MIKVEEGEGEEVMKRVRGGRKSRLGRYKIGSKFVLICLFKPCCCFMWTISETNLLWYEGSLSIILILSHSNSWLRFNQCSIITDGDPFFFLISVLCSLILVRNCLLVCPMYEASQLWQNILYTIPWWDMKSRLSLPHFINLLSVLRIEMQY